MVLLGVFGYESRIVSVDGYSVRRWFLNGYDVLIFEICCPEMPVDKHYAKVEKEVGVKGDEAGEQTYAMRKRMSAFPRVDTDISETANIALPNHFPQNEGPSSLPGKGRHPDSVFQTKYPSSVCANCLRVFIF